MPRPDLEELTERLDVLDERLAYKVRKIEGFSAPTLDQVRSRQDDLARYVLELKEIVRDLLDALRPPDAGA